MKNFYGFLWEHAMNIIENNETINEKVAGIKWKCKILLH